MRIALLGNPEPFRLEAFYKAAFESIGHQVELFNPEAYFREQIPLGRMGVLLSKIRPQRSWRHYANRQLLLDVLDYRPELVFAFCTTVLPVGSLALLKSRLPVKIGLIWPDTLFNLQVGNVECPSLYDGVSCYGQHGIRIFQQLGYRNVEWIPLGADPEFHGCQSAVRFRELTTDICFVGGWRPERERALLEIYKAIPEITVEIHGPNWSKQCRSEILKFCSGKTLLGQDYTQACRRSRININIIDDTNYPAANMRFFELPMAGVLQLSSDCPEMREIFCEKKHMLYYGNTQQMIDQVRWVLVNQEEAQSICQEGHCLAHAKHTYRHRAELLIKQYSC